MISLASSLLAALASLSLLSAPVQDRPDCKDHPLFNRMPKYDIYSCKTVDFDAVDFAKPNLKQWGRAEDYDTIEGTVFNVSYKLKKGETPGSALQIIRNFQNAAKAAGGVVLGDFVGQSYPRPTDNMKKFMADSPGGTSYDRYTTLKVTKGDTEYWVNVAASDSYQDYNVVVVERHAMAQEVSLNELVAKLNKDGFLTLYINFDINKATIKPESNKTLDDAAGVLKAASTLSITVAGHTDNVGAAELNMKLSDERAKAVMSALVQRGISAARLTAKGFGQTQPIADNRTEDGRAKNRRVELVKK